MCKEKELEEATRGIRTEVQSWNQFDSRLSSSSWRRSSSCTFPSRKPMQKKGSDLERRKLNNLFWLLKFKLSFWILNHKESENWIQVNEMLNSILWFYKHYHLAFKSEVQASISLSNFHLSSFCDLCFRPNCLLPSSRNFSPEFVYYFCSLLSTCKSP